MKYSLLCALLLIMSFNVLAQEKNPPLVENFAKKVHNSSSLVFDDHLNILALQTDDDKYEILGVDENMQSLWKIALDANNVWLKKFNGKILVIASLANKTKEVGDINYTGYVVESATGKITTNKVVYHAMNDFVQQPQVFTGKGDFFKLAVRTTTRKENVNMFSDMFKSGSTVAKEWNQTADLRIISYNEKLDTINTLKPVTTNGIFLSLTVNNNQDVFIGWFNRPSMEIYKYDAGQSKPSNFLTVPVDFKTGKNSIVANSLLLIPSEDKNIVNFSLIYNNEKNSTDFGIGRLNFSNNQKKFVTQTFNKEALNKLKKGFQPINKDLNDVNFGLVGGINIQHIEEANGKLIVALAHNWYESSKYGTYYLTGSIIVSGYDEYLNLNFMQVLPTISFHLVNSPTIAFHMRKNELNILANTKTGLVANACTYSVLDINTGKWVKMYKLSKKKIPSLSYSRGSTALWFGDRFMVPYFSLAPYSKIKNNIDLQSNFYRD